MLVAVVALWLMTGSVRGTLVPLVANLTATFWAYGAMAAGRLGPEPDHARARPGDDHDRRRLRRARVRALRGGGARARQTRATAALESLRHTLAPVLISGCTTMVGFAALLINEIPATSELGGFCVFGVGVDHGDLADGRARRARAPAAARRRRQRARSSTPRRRGSPKACATRWKRALGVLGRWQVRHARRVLAFWGVTGASSRAR